MSIFTGIVLIIATVILTVFVSYLFWDHSKKPIDTRPEDVAQLALANGWAYSAKNPELGQLIKAKGLGYMGDQPTIKNVCVQSQSENTIYIFDCIAATLISGIAIEFTTLHLPSLQVVERLIQNRLGPIETSLIEAERLPRFIKAKVLAYAPAESHDQICALIAENGDLQWLLKERDLGYFCMQSNCIVFYFLTRYPAEQRDFGKVVRRAEQLSRLFGSS